MFYRGVLIPLSVHMYCIYCISRCLQKRRSERVTNKQKTYTDDLDLGISDADSDNDEKNGPGERANDVKSLFFVVCLKRSTFAGLMQMSFP